MASRSVGDQAQGNWQGRNTCLNGSSHRTHPHTLTHRQLSLRAAQAVHRVCQALLLRLQLLLQGLNAALELRDVFVQQVVVPAWSKEGRRANT